MTIKKMYLLSELGEQGLLKKKNGESYSKDYIIKLVNQKKLKTTLVAGYIHLVDQEAIDDFNKERLK